MLFSILGLGLGIGATAYSLLRDRENRMQQNNQPITQFLKNSQINPVRNKTELALAEFSDELMTEPSKKADNNDFEDSVY
jgi:glutamine synthetase adenylyltransferase